MLRAEAAWIGAVLQGLPDAAFPLLNIGSSTEVFRRREQPWIDTNVFAPLRERGRTVVHVDLKAAAGVDVVADICDVDQVAEVAAVPYASILCSNVLEHLPQPRLGIEALLALTRPGQHLVVTGPRRFPPHPDPIDNGFRPTAARLAAAFGDGVVCLRAEEVADRRMVSLYADSSDRGLLGVAAALGRPWRDVHAWSRMMLWSLRTATAAAVHLQRTSDDVTLETTPAARRASPGASRPTTGG